MGDSGFKPGCKASLAEPSLGPLRAPVFCTGVWGENAFPFWLNLPVHMRVHMGSGLVRAVCGVISVWAQVFFLPRLPAPPLGPPFLCWGWGEGEAFLAGALERRREGRGERKLQT